MKILKTCLVLIILACFNIAFANEVSSDVDIQNQKELTKKKFKKKEKPQKPKMVETKEEWDIESQEIPLNERKLEEPKEEKDKKKYIPDTKYVFKRYNYPQGAHELNLEDLKTRLFYYSYLIVDNNCRYAAYVHYYYSPDVNQISSNLFVEELDTTKSKQKRILEYRHKQQQRVAVAKAGIDEYYPNLFNGLSVVDWSRDSKKVLVKERVGSTQGGIYKTYMHVHFLADDVNNRYTIKLVDLDSAIKNYFIDWENKQIVKYRYDIEPLGFSDEDDNVVLAHCFAYDTEGKKVFLGTWGYDVINYKVYLLSRSENVAKVSANGLILKQVLD